MDPQPKNPSPVTWRSPILVHFQGAAKNKQFVTCVKDGGGHHRKNVGNEICDPHNATGLLADEGAKNKATGAGVMLKTVYAIAAAAIVAGAFVTALSVADQVDARGSAPGVKADRADARPLARQCSQNAWPYFEASCLRDTRNAFGQAREVVRVVSTDRLTSTTVGSSR